MSYREHMHALATSLAELVRDGASVPVYDLPATLTAHATLVQLLSTVHHELTGITAQRFDTTLSTLDRHPVAMLGRTLHAQPQHQPVPLTQTLIPGFRIVGGALGHELWV